MCSAVEFEETDERLQSGWHFEPPLLELIEQDHDSPQRKRFVRSQQQLEGSIALNPRFPLDRRQQAVVQG